MMNNLLPNTISRKLAIRIVSQNEKFLGQTDGIRYGLEWIISTLNLYFLVCIIAIPLNILPESLVFAVTSSMFRTVSGGAHCKGYFPCLIFSTLQVVLSSILIHYTFSYLIPIKIVFIILLFLSFLTTVLLAPVLYKKKNCFNESQLKRFKMIAIFVFMIFLTLSLTLFKDTHVMYSIWFALIIQSLSLTYPAKIILDFLSNPFYLLRR